MKDFYYHTDKRQARFEFRPYDRVMPGMELQSYSCEYCEDFKASSSLPYFKALALHGEHNKTSHPKQFPAPRVMMVYKA